MPEPEKNWHVKQHVTSAKWIGKGKGRKFVVEAVGDFGNKYRRDWGVFKLEAPVKFNLQNDERLLQPQHLAWEIAGGKEPALSHRQLSSFATCGPRPTLSPNSCAPKHVAQTAVHAFGAFFSARRGTCTVKKLQTAADFTEMAKRELRSSILKQAPLTRKVKEGIEIPKSYRDAGNFVTPQWHAAEKRKMKGILDSESW